ncbi:Vacuolar protein sorting-associated protein 8 [Ophidiomyces ophidiicola]|nr:Vacuolar protein sorting-associated protein 8 [Ophidiomyces ophidiicola]KAI2055257.1 Vacuolar protein sorting-associated protein 8 [Ophidiomyces ophidiicola]KAI2070229.1 Vacuolar protein sorting-associated protein 8 [Ophidiomyces ophidiicola]KAI2075491.1 Vacuolar protein sorting-associated protein 8 [Ophidiomyces ophidiicola]KAI2111086.1 Vacuolar protein sorting-associated protein 8 [Ophidiomyces ophidiicola]
MSSMTERGGDDAVRDDAIDLHDEEEDLRIAAANGRTNGVESQSEFDEFVAPDDPISITISKDDADGSSEHHDGTADSPKSTGPNSRSIDDRDSIPDDTPSVQGSIQSSPGSALGRRSPFAVSNSPHRPFDRRFQTRLSIPGSPRPLSPSFIQQHSRHSSLASQLRADTPDLPEEPSAAPWDVVRWTKLRKIAGQVLSEAGKRNFGRLTCIAVSTNIVLGTTKGVILVFDYQQDLRAVIGHGSKAITSGAVTSLAISADNTTVAGGHAEGAIFTWEISKVSKPFLHIPPIASGQQDFKRGDGHIAGVAVIHVGFLGTRRTALVSADDHGMAFSHLATRGMGAATRTVRTTRILGRYPESTLPVGRSRKPSTVLAFSPLPLGNVEQGTDSLGLVAMLTPYLLVIVSTTPVAQTQHKAARPKEVPAHSAMTATLAWFPAIKLKAKETAISKTKLVYCWSNVLTILEISEIGSSESTDKDKPPAFEFRPVARWRATEPIVAVQWISRSVLAVLTITQQLLILEDKSLRVTDSFDLLHKHIFHSDLFSKQLHSLVERLDEDDQTMHGVTADAFYMSFRAYKGRLFLLGFNDISVGTLSNWADRLLALMEHGDFIGSIRLATSFYIGTSEKLTVGLPEEDELRHEVVQEKLLEMMAASLKYAFGKNEGAVTERLQSPQLKELAEVCISACDFMGEYGFLFDDVYPWYEEHGFESVFLDMLEPYIIKGTIRALPPDVVKSLITYFSTSHTTSRLEETICLLDTSTIDIDQVTNLCKHYNLYDAFIYVWNRAIGDYISPLKELLSLATQNAIVATNEDPNGETKGYRNALKMFPYLSYTLTSRIYPTGGELDEAAASKAKADIYNFLCFGTDPTSPESHGGDRGDRSFKSLRIMLEFDTPRFMSMLNEAFEDGFLNGAIDETEMGQSPSSRTNRDLIINRQYLISILLEVLIPSSEFTTADTIYLDMFIARNLPKYPQYILLSGSILHQSLVRLCNYPSPDMLEDCQLSAEYLLSTYRPPDILELIPVFKEAKFFRILKSTYRAEKLYPELILTYLDDSENQEHVFICIRGCLRQTSALTAKQRRDVYSAVKEHAAALAHVDVSEAALTNQAVAADLHEVFVEALEPDPSLQYQYLDALIGPEWKISGENSSTTKFSHSLIERYIQLMCQYEPSNVAEFVDSMKSGDLQLEAVLPTIESSGIIDAVVILVAKQGEVGDAMKRLTDHLVTLETGLSGVLQHSDESSNSVTLTQAVVDLVQSLEKYVRVGIWLCKQETKSAKQPYGEVNIQKRGSIFELPLSTDENLWLSLIEAVMRITQNLSPLLQGGTACEDVPLASSWPQSADGKPLQLSIFLRMLVQQVFTALLTATTKSGRLPNNKADLSFLRILRAFLKRAASASPSLSELRAVIASILSAYSYEESLLSLANSMLDKDLFVHIDEVTKLRQRGWRARGQICELCRRRTWGPGSGGHVWEAWVAKQVTGAKQKQDRQGEENKDHSATSRGKGKALASSSEVVAEAPAGSGSGEQGDAGEPKSNGGVGEGALIVFGCRHLYHRSCLADELARRRQVGARGPATGQRGFQGSEEFLCVICTIQTS